MRTVIPLRQRPLDIAILAFYLVNIIFISYFFDLEQIVITDTSNFEYPLWPPRFLVDLSHWWGRYFDPLLLARPVWWRATIWIDALLFGPYYAVAIYAFYKGKDWIRIPSIIYASVMLTNVTIIMSEEFFGVHASGNPLAVVAANGPWMVFPLLILYRMYTPEHPFTVEAAPDSAEHQG